MYYEIKDVRNILGTFVSIKIFHEDKEEGVNAIREAFIEIYRIQALMSIYDQDSEVYKLNRDGFVEDLSEETRYVIERAIYYSELSQGRFDITILPLLKLWNEKRIKNEIPEDEEIKEARELVNFKNIVIDKDSIYFKKAQMCITLAAIAKGYAVDRAIEILRRHCIKHAIINAGGDIRAIGGKNGEIPWRIGIRDPINKGKMITSIEIFDKAIATSGTYYRPFNDMIDPRIGRPVEELISSTVISEKAIDADILSTLLFITEIRECEDVLRRIGIVKGIFVTSKGEVFNFLS